MEADSLHSQVWNAIVEMIQRQQLSREIAFGKIIKRDVVNKLVWLEEFGQTAIPIAAFDMKLSYYDTTETGDVTKRTEQSELVMPRVGQVAVVLNQSGNHRFPVCVGVIQSKSGTYWQGG